MREGTSGFWVIQKFGKITIGYEDYCVSEFGDRDFEQNYILDRINSIKFRIALKKEYKGSLEEMIEKAFGKTFNDRAFWAFCKKHKITYTTTSWTS